MYVKLHDEYYKLMSMPEPHYMAEPQSTDFPDLICTAFFTGITLIQIILKLI